MRAVVLASWGSSARGSEDWGEAGVEDQCGGKQGYQRTSLLVIRQALSRWVPGQPPGLFLSGHRSGPQKSATNVRPPPHAHTPRSPRAPGRHSQRMSTSRSPFGGAPNPAHSALPLYVGGNNHEDNDHDDDGVSPLLDLLQRFPDFEMHVLEQLDPTARASLARTRSAF